MLLLTGLCCFSFNFNPLSYYKNAKWLHEQPETIIDSSALSISQAIIDMKQAYEEKQLALEAELVKNQKSAEEIEAAKAAAKTVGESYGTIYVDRLGYEMPIYYGDDKLTLRKGPGQYTGSSIPGEGSQILIAGHNTTHFKQLQNFVTGDIIRFVTTYGEFHYQVTEIRIASMNDTTTYNLSLDHEQLVLYTCYPFSGPPGKTERYFVYADLITD